jgi:RNA polymerase sigma-70 factor (ECF subfamily)
VTDVNGEMALRTAPAALATIDSELVVQARSGVAEAREELARRYREPAYLLGLQLTGNREDALDVAQDALLRFFATLDRFQEGRPVRPYLLRIVRNRAMDLWRRRRIRRVESLEQGELPRQIADDRPGPEETARRAELRRRIWRAISDLAPAKREILVLRDYHDLAYAEIAKVLGIPIGTVMSRLHAARKALRELLVTDGFGPSGEEQ